MNIDNLMDELIKQGVDFKALSKAYDDAADRKNKRDTAAIETARANVLQALRKYVTVLYGGVDETIMKEFETTLKGMEGYRKAPTTFSMSMGLSDDDAKLEKFLKSLRL